MSYFVVCVVALLAAGLTLFSGFGLGTLLMPAFAVFFPVELAIAATAVVHLANNLFNLGLMGRFAHKPTLARFVLPTAAGALLGAWVLTLLGDARPFLSYTVAGHECVVTPVKVVVAGIIATFAVVELAAGKEGWSVGQRWVAVGGLVSGFFGGLSGHQGAPRSAFLIRCGLTKEQFIATGVVAACVVDVARLGVYASHRGNFAQVGELKGWGLVAAASGAAFAGSFIGSRLVNKVTLRGVRLTVALMLTLMAAALGAGVI